MSLHPWIAPALLVFVTACAAPGTPDEFAAKQRPLEERCVRAQPAKSRTAPDLKSSELKAEARAAARRGELDKACDWL